MASHAFPDETIRTVAAIVNLVISHGKLCAIIVDVKGKPFGKNVPLTLSTVDGHTLCLKKHCKLLSDTKDIETNCFAWELDPAFYDKDAIYRINLGIWFDGTNESESSFSEIVLPGICAKYGLKMSLTKINAY